MNTWFFLLTLLFIIVSAAMVLIILVQRPQGGGLAGAFGGAGGGGTDSVFGGRVGDALTVITVIAFSLYLILAIALNKVPIRTVQAAPAQAVPTITSADGQPIQLTPLDGPPPGIVVPELPLPDNDSTGSESDPPDNSDSGDLE
ncbi:MAG: preprotein translocase subunit SecG [Planctomycetes bacterium]|nr:preprotein translocase subunit SecG [Planctomycetota bacterium]